MVRFERTIVQLRAEYPNQLDDMLIDYKLQSQI